MTEGEDEIETALTAGEKLRAAREGLGLSIEDVATSTRIPTRHLTSLETGDFSKLPAPTYSVGFAKSYAGAVGLDRIEIGEQMREELGGSTRVSANQADQFEPMDPARAMPKWLIFAAIAAILVVVLAASWLSSRSLNAPDDVVTEDNSADPGLTVPAPAPADASGPVLITATEQAWIQVRDGTTMLKEGVLEPGQSFAVPPTATAPTLTTAKAEALKITVGTAAAPQIGPAATRVSQVSLLGPALLKGPATLAPTPAAIPSIAAPPPVARETPRPTARPVARPVAPPPAPVPTTNSAEPAAPTQ
ncbi:MAG: RodZ domain-containing protein [Sphingomicrobium sp.]